MSIMPAARDHFDETLAAASPDLLRTMVREFAQRMMTAELDELVVSFRSRPDGGPYTFVWIDALTRRCARAAGP
ncbi:hypothetical protein [Nonomuraea cavernae]|nr:hypothetical protein [Nonomuraea cavernae]MCA2187202.1 hypothetical protein [Nonomuraea cavernae]